MGSSKQTADNARERSGGAEAGKRKLASSDDKLGAGASVMDLKQRGAGTGVAVGAGALQTAHQLNGNTAARAKPRRASAQRELEQIVGGAFKNTRKLG